MENKRISVVIPLYNEEAILAELWKRLLDTLAPMDLDWKVVFVNDGSNDTTPELLKELCQEHPRVACINLSRNFGHQSALNAGVDLAEGDALILMDGDLQDQPEEIPAFLKEWENGADVVYAIRGERQESVLIRPLFKTFYRLLAYMSGIKQPMDAGIFGLLDRKVVDTIRSMPEHNRYFPGLRAYAGFVQRGVSVNRGARHAGKPKVGFKGLFKLAFDAIFSFSYLPIRIISGIGLGVALISFIYFCSVLYARFVSGEAILGWASTLGAILFLGGLQIVMLGIVGEYVARIYEETKRRPNYIVGDVINLSASDSE